MALRTKKVKLLTPSHVAALAAALLFSTAAVSAQAATDTPAAAPATQPAPLRSAQNAHDPNEVVCRREEEIGTRLGGHKTCHTRADWANMARDAATATNAAQSNGGFFNPGGH